MTGVRVMKRMSHKRKKEIMICRQRDLELSIEGDVRLLNASLAVGYWGIGRVIKGLIDQAFDSPQNF